MSRLYTIAAPIADIANHFGTEPAPSLEVPTEMTEGLRGLVVIERDGRRLLRSMVWGFPRKVAPGPEHREESGIIGLVADLTNPMWERVVVDPRYRCLIVLTHFANPAGEPGSKRRTWFSIEGQPIAAWAGFCRVTSEFGPAFAGMTMEANAAIPPTNDRMPVLLDPANYGRWLHGSIEDVIAFQYGKPIDAERMRVERTKHVWKSGGLPVSAKPQTALL
ncbi:SOS response-associated peptidase family protein [Flavisphingomonas formosensis]|uniref:SOS response-associated peptidase family protein n=1 Tax=Flavisphingomonas formosensis TaxID=861534 RepID=UPI0012FC532D|nr:SOS response-associated peptidase family protein [Sphingomonas formosensis]